jgi:hypothetical protein
MNANMTLALDAAESARIGERKVVKRWSTIANLSQGLRRVYARWNLEGLGGNA